MQGLGQYTKKECYCSVERESARMKTEVRKYGRRETVREEEEQVRNQTKKQKEQKSEKK